MFNTNGVEILIQHENIYSTLQSYCIFIKSTETQRYISPLHLCHSLSHFIEAHTDCKNPHGGIYML